MNSVEIIRKSILGQVLTDAEIRRRVEIYQSVSQEANEWYHQRQIEHSRFHLTLVLHDILIKCDNCGGHATAGLIDDQFWCVECREEEEA